MAERLTPEEQETLVNALTPGVAPSFTHLTEKGLSPGEAFYEIARALERMESRWFAHLKSSPSFESTYGRPPVFVNSITGEVVDSSELRPGVIYEVR